jgi:hypothetical protein
MIIIVVASVSPYDVHEGAPLKFRSHKHRKSRVPSHAHVSHFAKVLELRKVICTQKNGFYSKLQRMQDE